MKSGVLATLILVLIAAALGSKYIGIRNSLAAERESINAAWTEVNTAMERRAELVPELARLVRQGAPAEIRTLEPLAGARARLDRARGVRQKVEANTTLDTALAAVMIVMERYPKVENSRNYRDLLDALKESEYRIAVARRKYNEAVEHYNTRLALFPNNLVASVSRFGKIDAYIPTFAGTQTPSKLEY